MKDHRVFLLRRLERLVQMRRDYDKDLNAIGRRLLDGAIIATAQELADTEALAPTEREA